MVIIRIQNFDYQVAKETALVVAGKWPRQVVKVSMLNQVVSVALAIGQSVHVELMRSGLRREEINTDDMRMDGVCALAARLSGHHHYLLAAPSHTAAGCYHRYYHTHWAADQHITVNSFQSAKSLGSSCFL